MTHLQMCSYFIHCYAAIFLHDVFNCCMPSGVTTRCAWPGRGQSVTELMPFINFPVHSYTCCSDRHASPYWTFIRRWISMGFTPVSPLFFFDACCKRGRHIYITTAPSCCIPASYCHLSATLQTISITVVNLQDNRAVIRNFIALLRSSFDSPSYLISATWYLRTYLSSTYNTGGTWFEYRSAFTCLTVARNVLCPGTCRKAMHSCVTMATINGFYTDSHL